ncbi:hypothetical protein GCM10009747_33790 [Agromyces humatus]|uniref:Lipoprotein n=1 Tax=Agromyces humatus TaxID=279573 RepID=A0ABP4X4Z8_9MICO
MEFALVAAAAALAATLAGCTAPDCRDETSTSITVHTIKPGAVSVQCWSGCIEGGRELAPPTTDGEWTAELDVDQPTSITLAVRGASGGLLFAERFRLEWSGCPATPSPDVLELLQPEGGSGG